MSRPRISLRRAAPPKVRPDLARKRIVFLDIDGVLNSADSRRRVVLGTTDPKIPNARLLDPQAIALLNSILARTEADVVLSSSWRYYVSVPKMQKMLEYHGFRGRLLARTPIVAELPMYRGNTAAELVQIGQGSHERGIEIQQWLDEQGPVQSYVILDDDDDMANLMPQLVHTSFEHGLTRADALRAVEILMGIQQR
jgi:hypothetical protein